MFHKKTMKSLSGYCDSWQVPAARKLQVVLPTGQLGSLEQAAASRCLPPQLVRQQQRGPWNIKHFLATRQGVELFFFFFVALSIWNADLHFFQSPQSKVETCRKKGWGLVILGFALYECRVRDSERCRSCNMNIHYICSSDLRRCGFNLKEEKSLLVMQVAQSLAVLWGLRPRDSLEGS